MPSIFLSYAHADDAPGQVCKLVERLDPLFARAIPEPFSLWRDTRRILIGDKWHDAIIEGLDQADYGLVLISPHCLNSDFIRREELPRLLMGGPEGAEGRLLPVVFGDVPWGRVDTGLIREHQCYAHEGRSWLSLSTNAHRDAFALGLFEQIHETHTRRSKAA